MEEGAGSDGSMMPAGSVVELTGLQAAALNGSLGVVKRFNATSGRYHVVKSQGTNACVGIKPENITRANVVQPSDPNFAGARRYQHVVFWPRVRGVDAIPVHSFTDWPEDWTEELQFLRRRLGYVNPQTLSGVESQGSAKPDFVMYFDAADTVSPINKAAVAIKRNLPGYEVGKLPREVQDTTPRGPCVLVYSPMTSSVTFSGGMGMSKTQYAPMTSGPEGRLFSLKQLRGTLLFQESAEGRAQYRAHDNPMHRMFGGMM